MNEKIRKMEEENKLIEQGLKHIKFDEWEIDETEMMKRDKCLWGTEKMWHCLVREDCSTCPYYKKVKRK